MLLANEAKTLGYEGGTQSRRPTSQPPVVYSCSGCPSPQIHSTCRFLNTDIYKLQHKDHKHHFTVFLINIFIN